jgi:putative DNA methylase
MPPRESITRRNLPHWYVPNAWHFVTYRLANTIPSAVLHQLRENRVQDWKRQQDAGETTPAVRERIHKQFFAAYDRYLDSNRYVEWLVEARVAAMIRRNLYYHHRSKYHLLAFCIMPNHVHLLIRPIEPAMADNCNPLAPSDDEEFRDETPDSKGPLAKIMHSLKSYTANEANRSLQKVGQFWQHESYDHWVRDEDELQRIVDYIAWNPVKANLVGKPHQWLFGSAHDRFLNDGEEEGYLLLE